MSESPVLLLSGGTELPNVGRGGFQEMDQIGDDQADLQGRLDAPLRR